MFLNTLLGGRDMSKTMGERLRIERTRLGLSQEALAAIGGVKKLTQLQYEANKTAPDADYLVAVAVEGVDVAYVLGLQRGGTGLSPRQEALLRNYDAADDDGRRIIEGTAGLAAQPKTPALKRR